jgi:hypothetical protein
MLCPGVRYFRRKQRHMRHPAKRRIWSKLTHSGQSKWEIKIEKAADDPNSDVVSKSCAMTRVCC